MIFRQLFDSTSGTYSYLLASRRGGEALIIDPVLEKVERYLQLLRELDLTLVKAVDTHLHADHITGLGALRDRTHCITVMGEQSGVDAVSMRVSEGDRIDIYPVHVMTRKSFGLMTRKLSVTESQRSAQFRGTVSRRKPSVASANWAHVA